MSILTELHKHDFPAAVSQGTELEHGVRAGVERPPLMGSVCQRQMSGMKLRAFPGF